MTNRSDRMPAWQRNNRLENLLGDLARHLSTTPIEKIESDAETPNDVLLVLGVGRSGTSLLLQYLAASGAFAYPSNLISRFYMAPHIGQLVQTLLLDPEFDHAAQFADLREGIRPISFVSQLGKTASTLEPNEFWYFWRRFFDFEQGTRLSAQQLNTQGADRFRNELASWTAAAQKPIAMKAVTASWNIAALAEILPGARFLIMQRDPADIMISLLNARFKYWGNIDNWYGLALPKDIGISPKDPYEQVALQVAAFDIFVVEQNRMMPASNRHIIDYEAFCAAPGELWTDEFMAQYLPIPDKMWHDYRKLKFDAKRAIPDEPSPHQNISRAELLALYHRFCEKLKSL